MKTAKATVTAVLYTSKTLANGEHPILIRVCYNGKRKYKSTGLGCPVKYWNPGRREVRERHPLAANMNALIDFEVMRLRERVLECELRGQSYSAQSLIDALQRKPPARRTLQELLEARIAYFRDTKQKHNTAAGYRTLLRIVERFAQGRTVELCEVDGTWLGEFEEYLHAHYADTSTRRFLSAFKALMNDACRNGMAENNPFDRFRLSRKLDTRTAKRALDIDEMNSLVSYYLDTYYYERREKPDPRSMKRHTWRGRYFTAEGEECPMSFDAEQFSLAMFVCSYIFQGLALVDLARLKWKELVPVAILNREKYDRDRAAHGVAFAAEHRELTDFYEINLVRAKTQHPARVLIEKSVAWPYMAPFAAAACRGDNFVFPIYLDDDPLRQFERISYANGLINQCLQRAAERIGLKRRITFYSARHTYASRLYHADVPLPLIAQNMGRNPAEIETYLKEFDTDRIIGANRQTWQLARALAEEPDAATVL